MRIDSFIKKIGLASVGLALLVAALSLYLLSTGPRVRYVQFPQDFSLQNATKNSSIQIVFDRPLRQADYTQLIRFTPAVDFTAQTNTQNISLTLNENLMHDTEYTLRLSAGVMDSSDKQMDGAFEQSFTSSSPEFAYIERNYSDDPDSLRAAYGEPDTVFVGSLNSDPTAVFSSPVIRSISANRDFILIVSVEERSDELSIFNRDTGETTSIKLPFSGRIEQIQIARLSTTAVFALTPDFDSLTRERYVALANRTYQLDASTGAYSPLNDADDQAVKSFDIHLDTAGQVALLESSTKQFFATSPFNDFDPALLGTYGKSFGFVGDESQILFRDREGFSLYDVVEAENNAINFRIDGSVQDVRANTNSIFYSTSSFTGGAVSKTIFNTSDWTEEADVIWASSANDPKVLADFYPSFDGAYVALQQNPTDCTFDGIGAKSACRNAAQQIIGAASGDTIAEFDGINLIWLP